MTDLTKIRCVGCEGGIPPLTADEMTSLLSQVNEWEITADNKILQRKFSFKNFYHTMAFVNAIAWIAHHENHHPDMEVGFNYCIVKYTTHAVQGLTQNDFICAAKINAL